MSAREEFFIGWTATPPRLRGFLRRVAGALLLGLVLTGLLLAGAARDPAGARFATVPGQASLADLPIADAVEGILLDGPSPLLHLPESGRTLLLSADGKLGPPREVAALAGRRVRAEGFVLRRGDIEMLVLNAPPLPIPGAAIPVPPVPLGRWRITGEICDGKCAAGGMRPGTGIAHRACATLCLDGEIPAVFVATGPVAGHAFLVLADRAGGPPMPAFRDLIGQRVTLEGEVARHGGLLVFRAERP